MCNDPLVGLGHSGDIIVLVEFPFFMTNDFNEIIYDVVGDDRRIKARREL